MHMRSLVLAAALSGVPLVAATAADMSVPQTKAPAYVAPPIFVYSWTGLYIGGQLGGAWSSANWTDPVSGLGDNPTASAFMGGGQIGYNYQTGPWVLGIEADITGTNLSASNTDAAGFTHSTNTFWTSTVTGRLGYAWNRVLVYGKGGVAFANEGNTVTGPIGASISTGASTQTGWTAGGGIEYALDRNWSVRGEYDYMGFGSQNVPALLPGAPGSVNLNIQRAMAGINYRF